MNLLCPLNLLNPSHLRDHYGTRGVKLLQFPNSFISLFPIPLFQHAPDSLSEH